MERLTKHSKQTSHENGICCTHFYGPECLEVGGNCAMNCKWEEAAWSRLAAYEDTGLEPEEVERPKLEIEAECVKAIARTYGIDINRLRKLAEADREGRVVVLPCKVGDMMYKIFKERTECSAYGECFDEYSCSGCECECDSTIQYVIRPIQSNTLSSLVVYIGDIGKTVFLTREEAEKALGAMKDE